MAANKRDTDAFQALTGSLTESLIDINRLIHEPARLMIMAYLYVVESGDFTALAISGMRGDSMNEIEAQRFTAWMLNYVSHMPVPASDLAPDTAWRNPDFK